MVKLSNKDIVEIPSLIDVTMVTTFWPSMGYNFSCMIASDTLFDSKRKGKKEYSYSTFLHQGTHKALRHGSHSFYLQTTPCLPRGVFSGTSYPMKA